MKNEVVLASHNPGKLREFQQLLEDSPFQVCLYPATGEIVAETGDHYAENARLKARFVAQSTGSLALADDSGIEVDALDGLPGVHSARFVGSDPWRNSREILTRLMAVAPQARTARMRAALCLAWPDGRLMEAEGVLEGVILGWPKGSQGFGYDPIFSIDGQHSLAELPFGEKNRLSHRAQAVRALVSNLSRDR